MVTHQKDIKALVKKIVSSIVSISKPEKVILFGSGAREAMGPHSDLDFLVVKSCENTRKVQQDIYQNLPGFEIGVDIVVVTPEDIEEYKDCSVVVIHHALKDGRTVYAA